MTSGLQSVAVFVAFVYVALVFVLVVSTFGGAVAKAIANHPFQVMITLLLAGVMFYVTDSETEADHA